MRAALAIAAALLATGCAGYQALVPGESTLAEVEAAMGAPAERRERADRETWLYYPNQPFGRKVLVARVGHDGKLRALEQRLTDEYVAKLVPDHSRKDDVLDLFGPPYEASAFPRMQREAWSWHMQRYGIIPAWLHVQMSPDGVVREVYIIDEDAVDDRMFR